MREIALKIGKPTPLTAIATVPDNFDSGKPAVLILNSGVMHHIGSCRISVKIARELAQAGFLATRFDFSGIGDSEPRRGTASFEESSSAEITEVMDYLSAKKGVKKFIVYGLCSGADASYEIAKKDTDDRIIGMIQIDSYCYPTLKSLINHYGPRLLKLDAWVRFLSKLFRHPQQAQTSSEDLSEETPSYIRIFPPRKEIEQGLQSICDKNIYIYNIFTSDALDKFNYQTQYEDSFSNVTFNGRLKVDYYPDLDHIITCPDRQERIPKDICEWVQMVWDKQALT